jgi:hypothetical protein
MKVWMIVMAVALCGLPKLSPAEECDSLQSHSSQEAIKYLQTIQGDQRTRSCVHAAFKEISSMPSDQALPILLQYIAYKRPLTDIEKKGVSFSRDPGNLYPAVQVLFDLGRDAVEPSLITFLGQEASSDPQSFENAVYLLRALRHGNVLAALEDLKAKRSVTADAAVNQRLRAAAQALNKWCDPLWKEKCEAASN